MGAVAMIHHSPQSRVLQSALACVIVLSESKEEICLLCAPNRQFVKPSRLNVAQAAHHGVADYLRHGVARRCK